MNKNTSSSPNSNFDKRVVIVGGGYGGLTLANKLSGANLDITLVSKSPAMETKMEFESVISHGASVDFCRVWLVPQLKKKNIKFVLGTMQQIDQDNQVVIVKQDESNSTLSILYDYLILSVGADSALPPVEGLQQYAQPVWWARDVENYKQDIEDRIQAASRELNQDARKELLTFTVIGGGASGVEIVGSLSEFLFKRLERMGISRSDATIQIIDSGESVLKQLDMPLRKIADQHLQYLGVDLILNTRAQKLTEHTIELQNGQTITKGLALFAGGARVSKEVGQLNLPMTDRGRIKVDANLCVKGFNNIFAIGDCAGYTPPGEKREIPMLAQHAQHMAMCVAQNIKKSLKGEKLEAYDASLDGEMVSIGSDFAVGHVKNTHIDGWLASMGKLFSFLKVWYDLGGLGFVFQRLGELKALRKYVKKSHAIQE